MDQSTLRRLALTPVGRRWVLKVGGASALAAALAAGLDPVLATAKPHAPKHPKPKPTPARSRRRHRDVYAALPRSGDYRDLVLRVAAQDHPVRPVTDRDRRRLRRLGGLYALIDANKITHIAERVPFVDHAPTMMVLLGRPRSGRLQAGKPEAGKHRTSPRQGVLAQRMAVPPAAATRIARVKIRLAGSVAKAYRDAPWIESLGIRRARSLNRLKPQDLAELDMLMDDASTGAALVNMHPEILNLDDDSAAITTDILLDTPEVAALGDSIAAMREEGELPYWMTDVIDPTTGDQLLLTDADGNYILDPDTGQPEPAQMLTVSPDLNDSYGTAVRASLTGIKAEPSLEGSTYYVQPSDAPTVTDTDSDELSDPELTVQLSRSGWNWGTRISVQGFDQDARKIDLRFYNNWERVLQTHVQYFADADTQTPVDNHDQDPDSDQSWRSTPNSEYLTYVSDMPTSYGIPWAYDENYTSASITLPDDANYARILLCGPGSSSGSSQWRQYMNNDGYPGQNFPDECKWPLILTWVFDIGVPSILLGCDAAIAGGEAISAYKSAIKYSATAAKNITLQADDGFASFGDLGAYLRNGSDSPPHSPSEEMGQMALSICPFLWSSDPNMALFGEAAALVTAMIIEYALTKAIPVMGEVFGALAAAGDLAQIATSSAEMALSPWVIDCEVRLTYAAEITLLHDPKDATWPRAVGGARWTLQVITDGTDNATSLTGTIPDGQSDPIVVQLPAVAVSRTIQYTFQLVDVNQNMIGKGQSDVLANNDTSNLPTELTIQTQELFKPITDQTIFVRQDTLQATSTAGRYHWQAGATVTGTVNNVPGDLAELDTVSVGTVSGMLGSIWRSNDTNRSYWVRNTPTVENNDAGVEQQLAGPYTRRPFLVYDRLNPDLTLGNNFFLEPLDGGGYLVRRLILSADGGTLGWTPNQAWGHIFQDLSAVTYHPYGYLIGVNATTGKLQSLKVPSTPVADDAEPPLSSLYAGVGSRPGLTMSPTALTCTLDGVVIVLEGGANRMQAFDVNGNPVNYFGTDPDNRTSLQQLHGSVNDTRLGIAVDGQSFIYVLTRAGGSTAPVSNYRVDVHKPDGTFVVGPTGVNLAQFDVDYWRSIFGLDYAALTGPDGVTPYVDPALGRIQPSLSIFLATTPGAGQ